MEQETHYLTEAEAFRQDDTGVFEIRASGDKFGVFGSVSGRCYKTFDTREQARPFAMDKFVESIFRNKKWPTK